MIYDFIIIGAGPAGCFAAIQLARKKYHVLLIEQAEQNKMITKCCGDGISIACVKALRRVGFPVSILEEAGAVPIRNYYYIKNGNRLCRTINESEHENAYGLSRAVTDAVFRAYAENEYHVPVVYGEQVQNIQKNQTAFSVSGYQARKVMIAAGAFANIKLNHTIPLQSTEKRPVGVSMIVKGKPVKNGFFMFDSSSEFQGTYGWIFTIAKEQYNVGIWLKQPDASLRQKLDSFYMQHQDEWIGQEAERISPVRGGILGIGKPNISPEKDIIFIGDFANTCDSESGEGLSKAILSAEHAVNHILEDMA